MIEYFTSLLLLRMPNDYDIKHLPKSRCQLVLTSLDDEALQKAEKKALQEFGEGLKLKGFRPGNIPEDKVREHVQEPMLLIRKIEYALPEIIGGILDEKKLRITGAPDTKFESMDPLKIVVEFDVYPKVKLGKYADIKVKVEKKNIAETDVDAAIKNMTERMADFKEVERAAKQGDRTEIDFAGFTPDGVPLDNTVSKNHPVVLGQSTLIPGFEDNIIGMKKGEKKEFAITFPKDYHSKAMAGKETKFKVTVNTVQEIVPATVDEQLIEKVTGKKMNEEEFRKEVLSQLETQSNNEYERAYEDSYFGELIKICSIDPPQSMIDGEKETLLKELKQRILYQGLSYETYLSQAGKTEETLKESFEDQAKERVCLQMILQQIAEDEKIEIDDMSIEEELNRMTKDMDEEKSISTRKNYAQSTRGYILLSYQLKLRKVLELLLPHKQVA
jgi:trigger factor